MATAFDTTLSNLGIKSTPAASTSNVGQTSLGQADFLKLMTAQLQNQDPFAPMDNTQMVAQMASFSQLSGITEMSSTLKAISDKLGATNTSDAVSYIGKTVLTAGATAYGRTSGGIAGGVELAGNATNVTVNIQSADGRLLRTVDMGAQDAGTLSYDWDGKLADGTDAGPGPFTVSVSARNGADAIAAQPLVWAPVQSVSTTSGHTVLTLPGLGEVPATQVRQIG
jgi:flagellar basal-body rod modification protein FlgD